jgi:hypothetical protein
MALIIVYSSNFIELSLDGTTDFDPEVDLIALGVSKNAPDGLRVRKITFVPSAVDDTVVIRDGQNGPRIFSAVEVLGVYDILKDEYRDDGRINMGKVMNPYIHFNESVVGVVNEAYVIFEL